MNKKKETTENMGSKRAKVRTRDLCQAVFSATGVDIDIINGVIGSFLECIILSFVQGSNVQIEGFGTFKLVKTGYESEEREKEAGLMKEPEHKLVFVPDGNLRLVLE